MRATRKTAIGVFLSALAMASALSTIGCGYSFRAPFDRSIRTVYVPMARSQSFKRDLNLQMTTLVKDMILIRTPYKVVGSPEGADTTLDISIRFVDKIVSVESPNDLPRQVTGMLYADVKWVDNRPIDPAAEEPRRDFPPVTFVENMAFYPELGETSQLGWQKIMSHMAEQIVGMMEEKW